MTANLKFLFNTFLYFNAHYNGIMFTERQDFTGFEESNAQFFKELCELEELLVKYKNVNPYYYLMAPFVVRKTDKPKYISLRRYLDTREMFAAYNEFAEMVFRDRCPPEIQRRLIEDSFPFITKFCTQNKLTLNQYATGNSIVPIPLQHLSQLRISPYIIFLLPGCWSACNNVPEDVVDLTVGNMNTLYEGYQSFRINVDNRKLAEENMRKLCDAQLTPTQ